MRVSSRERGLGRRPAALRASGRAPPHASAAELSLRAAAAAEAIVKKEKEGIRVPRRAHQAGECEGR